MKINTVDYNVKKLVRAGLIEKSSHWWSVKGRKMITYKVSDRKIIISPKKFTGKIFTWAFGLTGFTALIFRWLANNQWTNVARHEIFTEDAVFGAPKMEALSAGVREVAIQPISDIGFWAGLANWEWILLGAWLTLVLFFILTLYNERRYKL